MNTIVRKIKDLLRRTKDKVIQVMKAQKFPFIVEAIMIVCILLGNVEAGIVLPCTFIVQALAFAIYIVKEKQEKSGSGYASVKTLITKDNVFVYQEKYNSMSKPAKILMVVKHAAMSDMTRTILAIVLFLGYVVAMPENAITSILEEEYLKAGAVYAEAMINAMPTDASFIVETIISNPLGCVGIALLTLIVFVTSSCMLCNLVTCLVNTSDVILGYNAFMKDKTFIDAYADKEKEKIKREVTD